MEKQKIKAEMVGLKFQVKKNDNIRKVRNIWRMYKFHIIHWGEGWGYLNLNSKLEKRKKWKKRDRGKICIFMEMEWNTNNKNCKPSKFISLKKEIKIKLIQKSCTSCTDCTCLSMIIINSKVPQEPHTSNYLSYSFFLFLLWIMRNWVPSWGLFFSLVSAIAHLPFF